MYMPQVSCKEFLSLDCKDFQSAEDEVNISKDSAECDFLTPLLCLESCARG